MALRELVTGNDACTPAEGGAGPSNAMASLADSLLGRSSKVQERLRELPGMAGAAGPSGLQEYAGSSASAAAFAAAEEDAMAVPGAASSSGYTREANGFGAQHGFAGPPSVLGHVPPEFAEFEDIYAQARFGRPPGFAPGRGGPPPPLTGFLHAFLESAKARTAFQPLPMPAVQLSPAEQCRVRDRSTIMARQLFAERGDEFADAQVGQLLLSLNIDPAALPAGAPGADHAAWNAIFRAGGPRIPERAMAADVAAGGRMAAATPPGSGWVDEFGAMSLGGRVPAAGAAWAGEFQGAPGTPAGWAEQFQAEHVPGGAWAEQYAAEERGPGAEWASEFQHAEAAAAEARAGGRADASGDALAQTHALAATLAADKDGKFANSRFLQFVSKMSRGEIVLENNEAKTISATSAQWAREFNESQAAQRDYAAGGTWAEEFAGKGGAGGAWADQFAAGLDGGDWAEQFARDADAEAAQQNGAAAAAARGVEVDVCAAGVYVFAPDNPFVQDTNSFARGRELFRGGLLTEAVLALEAEVQRQPGNVPAWLLLGTIQAENDDDLQAIAAWNRALEAEPGNAEVLLSMGVSYTNELDQGRALGFLRRWLERRLAQGAAHPELLAAARAGPIDSSQRLRHASELFERASAQMPGDADVHVALGVLRSLARDYGGAADAFRTALAARPDDYSLWNKLGATLANSGRSGEAVGAYQRALDLKPNYMRAWANMGISQASLGNYDAAARYYTRALGLNPNAAAVWGYLRSSLTCGDRVDLLAAVADSDLETLQRALPL
ncbi:hypothetical protein WJX81_004650 [Elliptochloris bilobata]|uniref:Peroxin-5 n=1 Tax=Elliptochloris bilobata TaxID=381761 RepID=A0AAW1RTR6_9CHLO